MQFENGMTKWAGRVPPLDLSGVTVCPRETDRRWHKIQPSQCPKTMYGCDHKIGNDGLPIGRCIFISSFKIRHRIEFDSHQSLFNYIGR